MRSNFRLGDDAIPLELHEDKPFRSATHELKKKPTTLRRVTGRSAEHKFSEHT